MNIQEIVEIINEYLSKCSSLESIELEIRLGIYDQENKCFDSNIGEENFDTINNMLNTFNGWDNVNKTNITNIYGKNLRLTINNETKETNCIEKVKLKNFTFISETLPLDFRISINREIDTPVSKFPKARSKLMKRNKNLVSREYQNALFELSQIDTEEKNSDIVQTFEYEIEHNGPLCEENMKESIFQMIYKALDANFMIDGFMKTRDNPLPLEMFSAQMV